MEKNSKALKNFRQSLNNVELMSEFYCDVTVGLLRYASAIYERKNNNNQDSDDFNVRRDETVRLQELARNRENGTS